jgi:type V secretory pathway adhesin AidA
VIRTYQGIQPMIEYDPGIIDNLDNDAAVRAIGEGFSIPAPVLRGPEQVAEIRQARQQQQQAQQMAQMGTVAADATKKLADAGKSAAQAKQTMQQTGTPDSGAAPGGTPGQGGNVGNIIEQLRMALRGGGR